MEFSFREIEHGSGEYEAACHLRNAVLRKPLGLDLFDEDLTAESGFMHLAGFDREGELIAYLQFKPWGQEELKMQQVAVAEPLRGRGVGRAMVEFAEGLTGSRDIVLHARETVVKFYEALGYERVGERFTEIGIPHWKMRKAGVPGVAASA